MKAEEDTKSAASEALAAAGDRQQAEDVSGLENASDAAGKKLNLVHHSLVERMVFGDSPSLQELCSGGESFKRSASSEASTILQRSLEQLTNRQAFTGDNAIAETLRQAVAGEGAYGFTVPQQYGGLGLGYSQLAILEEALAANGLGSLAVELSGQLTIGSSALLGYGNPEQCETFLPRIASGNLIAFALTEVGVGVNAKRVQAWVEPDEENACWRLHAEGPCNKLYITSASHGGLAAVVARKGKAGKDFGLFIVELPMQDMEGETGFHCEPSNTSAFPQNINSRLSFRNFPVPYAQEIQGDGVEVLFYCLRLGRCMLAAMSAGFQRMMAADAVHYARKREGVGGLVIKHELPRLGIVRMLGGALVAQAFSHLALAQDAAGVDLAGLRDITKSASARHALESLIACERVLGGRSLDKNSRISDARSTLHAFGIVEGEDYLIRLGMIKDISAEFTRQYLQGLLAVLRGINLDKNGELLPPEKRIYKLGLVNFLKYPGRVGAAIFNLIVNKGVWKLLWWCLSSLILDLLRFPMRLLPTAWIPRYKSLPGNLGYYLRYSERELKKSRWLYLGFNVIYQLELTQAQLPLQRLGKRIELLMSMAVVCCHAARLDKSIQHIAEAQAELIKLELCGLSFLANTKSLRKIRRSVQRVIQDIQEGSCSLLAEIEPQAFAHNWEQTDQAK